MIHFVHQMVHYFFHQIENLELNASSVWLLVAVLALEAVAALVLAHVVLAAMVPGRMVQAAVKQVCSNFPWLFVEQGELAAPAELAPRNNSLEH
jgi:hypothetical protein